MESTPSSGTPPPQALDILPELYYHTNILMACPDPSRGVYLTYLIQALILLSVAYSLTAGEYFLGFSAGIAFLLTLVPSLMTRNMRLCLPWEVNLFIAVSLYLHVMGHVGGYYVLFAPYYDKLTHLVSSVTVALLAFFAAVLAEHQGDIRLTRAAIVIFILTYSRWQPEQHGRSTSSPLTRLLGTDLQHGNTDTMVDLIVDLIGAAIVAAFAAIALARVERVQFIRLFADPSSSRGPG
jgi:hypothetical protein